MPDIPKNAKQPQDHKAVEAAKNEATEQNPVITFNGEEYEVLAKRVNTVGFMELIEKLDREDGSGFYAMVGLVRKMIGDEAWERFKEKNHDPDLDDVSGDALADFFDAMNDAAGNQQASSGS